MIGSPLAVILMHYFQTPTSVGVWQTSMAWAVYVFMMAGAFAYRRQPNEARKSLITARHVHVRDAYNSTSFLLIWLVLTLNVSAGIGVIGIASPMLQEIFGGSLIGKPDLTFAQVQPTRGSKRPRQRLRLASSACFRCSISLAASSGHRSPTISAAK